MSVDLNPITAQAHLHHQYLIGLQLMVSSREGADVIGDWIFRLFRRQHADKFLSSFKKLGLNSQPDAVACAKYHVLSNSIGGVRVEYMEESDTKAWVRFRYPRWIYDGPAICGMPVEASRGFLKGWYAQNGITLNNPRLGFVCVSEDMTGQFGFCGYFKEFDKMLTAKDRLQFAPDETPPKFDPSKQPIPPAESWSDIRLATANRNYALEFVRNGIRELIHVLGRKRAIELGSLSARLTGLQQYSDLAKRVGAQDGGPEDAVQFLKKMFRGMGDFAEVGADKEGGFYVVQHSGLRIIRGIEKEYREDLLSCWIELWKGAIASHRTFMEVTVKTNGDELIWTIKGIGIKR